MTRKASTIPTGLLLTGAVWPAISMHNSHDEVALSDADNVPNNPGEEVSWGGGVVDELANDENQNDSPHWLEESWPTGTDVPIEGTTEATAVDASDSLNKNGDVT